MIAKSDLVLRTVNSLLVLGCCIGLTSNCDAQDENSPLTKAGGMAYFWADNFAVGLEREKAFARAPGFTHGLRLDYDGIDHNLVPGYQFKFYPFYYRSKVPYNGLFLGADPCFFMKVNEEGSIGPGLGILLGYQWRLGSRSALSLETNWAWMNNFEESMARPEGWNFFFLGFLKFGFQFAKK